MCARAGDLLASAATALDVVTAAVCPQLAPPVIGNGNFPAIPVDYSRCDTDGGRATGAGLYQIGASTTGVHMAPARGRVDQ